MSNTRKIARRVGTILCYTTNANTQSLISKKWKFCAKEASERKYLTVVSCFTLKCTSGRPLKRQSLTLRKTKSDTLWWAIGIPRNNFPGNRFSLCLWFQICAHVYNGYTVLDSLQFITCSAKENRHLSSLQDSIFIWVRIIFTEKGNNTGLLLGGQSCNLKWT